MKRITINVDPNGIAPWTVPNFVRLKVAASAIDIADFDDTSLGELAERWRIDLMKNAKKRRSARERRGGR